MKPESPDSAYGLLARSMHLLTWWRPTTDRNGPADEAPLERLRSLVCEANAAMLDAGERQAKAVAALNEELPGLILGAAKARDPQALLEAELAIASRIRRCAAECCEVWSGATVWGKTRLADHQATAKRKDQRAP
jgi:hypothetical protein